MMGSMQVIEVAFLAVIEGITEFLPVSSTGHLILAAKILGIPETEFTKSFDIIIQLGAIMSVVTLYFSKIVKQPALIKPLLIAFVPTGILGVLFYKVVKTYLLANDTVVVVTLAVVGLLLIVLERYWKKHPIKHNQTLLSLTPKKLLLIGLFQSFAMIPGVSRSASTIVGGMVAGLSRTDAVELSFLLAIPTMAAATGLDLMKSGHTFTPQEYGLLALGFGISWITALIVIKAFIKFVAHRTFTWFGVYRIIVASAYWTIMGA
jgi:undecaprenyl-diphosphatase